MKWGLRLSNCTNIMSVHITCDDQAIKDVNYEGQRHGDLSSYRYVNIIFIIIPISKEIKILQSR